MAFNAKWNSISYNGGGLGILGDGDRYVIDWGDGSGEVARRDRDDNGDGIPDTANPFHFYASDGVYDITVRQPQAGLPPQHLRAFLFSSETDDLTLGGSRNNDIMTAGSGADLLKGASGDDFLAGALGNDRILGQDGDDVLLAGEGNDTVFGGIGSDLLGGDVGDDRLFGEGDNDYLYGDAGRDAIDGGDGDDYLNGGNGVDRLTGGAGADLFDIAPPRDGEGNPVFTDPDRDVIADYQQGVDHLSVDQWSGERFAFLGTGRFTGDGHPEVRYAFVNGATIVSGDADGDRIADFSFRIEGQVPLTAEDFRI